MILVNALKKIRRVIIRNFRNIKKVQKLKKDKLYLSFGENCLTDNILSRYNIKSYSTPYSSARSNIEYILQIEKDNFKNFLNPEYMKYDYVRKDKVVRLTVYNKIENQYHNLHMNGFEFSHHDVLSNEELRDTMNRRCERLLNLKNKKLCIFYHNRYNENTNEKMLVTHLQELSKIYSERCSSVTIFMFTQVIVTNKEERRVEHTSIDNINIYKFYTLNVWEGTDNRIFWAKCDDDLISEMIEDAKKI